MSVTLTNVKQYIMDRAANDGSTRFDRVMVKIANDAVSSLFSAGKFDFAKRWTKQALAAPYTTGTVSINVDATALTGSGTTFTSAMAGRYIRLNGESALYRLVTFGSTTSFTIETYKGDANLSAVTYEIVDIRFAAPTNFLSFGWPQSDEIATPFLSPMPLEKIKYLHMHEQMEFQPRFYAIEQMETSSVPGPHIWVYPAPSSKQILELPYYVFPSEKTAGGDIFEIPFEAQDALWAFVDAHLAKFQKDDRWVALMALAKQTAQDRLGSTRNVNDAGVSQEYWPDGGVEIFEGEWGLAPGEPVYQ